MSKYLVTSSSYFEPFTYDELIKPVMLAQQAHDATQEAYDKMSMETSALENYISKDGKDDALAREMYQNYKTKLDTLQNNLWSKGVNAMTKRDLSNARSAYASDILRLQKAVEARQQRSKEYWDARHKNPDLVTGADPGLAGLDNYLRDDLYGQNYFTYDSNKFKSDIATEVRMRAGEMLRGLTDPRGVVRNPQLAGILTRVIDKGLTNAEVNAASAVVDSVIDMTPEQRQMFYSQNGISPVVSMLSETLVRGYDATGIRDSDASDSDRIRLLNQGKSGLAAGILGRDMKDFEDPYFKMNMAIRQAAAIKALSEKPAQNAEYGNKNETSTETITGQNRNKIERMMSNYGDKKNMLNINGKMVRQGLFAADQLYSGKEMARYAKILGFNPGRDPHKKDRSKWLTGEVLIGQGDNAKVYETMYNPLAEGGKGAMLIRRKGSGMSWAEAPAMDDLTRIYNEGRELFLNNYNRLKKEKPALVEAVKLYGDMNPDEQYKFYKENGIRPDVSLMDMETELMNQPGFKPAYDNVNTYVIKGGSDEGKYREKIGGYIVSGLSLNKEGNKAESNGQFRVYDGTTNHLHLINDGKLEHKTIKDPNDVFVFKDGKIVNIHDIKIDPDALLNGYIKVHTVQGNDVAVGLDMLESDRIRGAFNKAKERILDRMNNNPSEDEDSFMEYVNKQAGKVASEIRSVVGYMNAYKSLGSSGDNDNN